MAENARAALLRSHRRIGYGLPFAPLGHRLRLDPLAPRSKPPIAVSQLGRSASSRRCQGVPGPYLLLHVMTENYTTTLRDQTATRPAMSIQDRRSTGEPSGQRRRPSFVRIRPTRSLSRHSGVDRVAGIEHYLIDSGCSGLPHRLLGAAGRYRCGGASGGTWYAQPRRRRKSGPAVIRSCPGPADAGLGSARN